MIVRCIRNAYGALTKGKKYEVISFDANHYLLSNDLADRLFYLKTEFEVVSIKKVRCICNESDMLSITIGKEYDVLDKSDTWYTIINDIGNEDKYQSVRFVDILAEIQEQQIVATHTTSLVSSPQTMSFDFDTYNGLKKSKRS